jgi:hypothetical protein
VNRKLLVVVALAAVAALLAGAAVGRNLLSSAAPTAKRGTIVQFRDEVSKVSIDYPGSWHELPAAPEDATRALVATAPGDPTTLVLMRDSPPGFAQVLASSGLSNVTSKTLPKARDLTDQLIAANPNVKLLTAPDPVTLGGLAGWRYRYTSSEGDTRSAHDHYFLFKQDRLIQLMFQAIPAERLAALEPTFQKIAGTFRGQIS